MMYCVMQGLSLKIQQNIDFISLPVSADRLTVAKSLYNVLYNESARKSYRILHQISARDWYNILYCDAWTT